MPGELGRIFSDISTGERNFQQALAVHVYGADASVGAEEAMGHIRNQYRPRTIARRAWGAAWKTSPVGGMAKAALLGPFQSIIPMRPLTYQRMEKAVGRRGFLEGVGSKYFGARGGQVGRIAGRTIGTVGRTAGRFIGPIDPVLRIASGEKAWKAVPKSMAFFGGFEMGQVAGTAIGAAIGTALIPIPGVGTAVGAVGGFVAGMAGGMAAEAAMSKGIDFVDYLGGLGRRARQAEFGGQVSRSMTTRAAATMRQRSLAMMNRSGINHRSLLGRESVLQHLR